jgi:hypothetical protein
MEKFDSTIPEPLRSHPLRLPDSARELLDTLASDLRRTQGIQLSTGEVARGLCLLALECCLGTAGSTLERAFRLAASTPSPKGVQRALAELRLMEKKSDSTISEPLRSHPLRLPDSARELLDTVASDLRRAQGIQLSTGEVARGLCLLALECCLGTVGSTLERAFRLAASTPSQRGVRRALAELRLPEREATDPTSLADEASTERTPPTRPSPRPDLAPDKS